MRMIRQAIRGCGYLPHVGEHPGTIFLIAMIGAGAVAGVMKAPHPVIGIVVGGGIMAVVLVPIFLCGAYSRAQLSDKLSARKEPRA